MDHRSPFHLSGSYDFLTISNFLQLNEDLGDSSQFIQTSLNEDLGDSSQFLQTSLNEDLETSRSTPLCLNELQTSLIEDLETSRSTPLCSNELQTSLIEDLETSHSIYCSNDLQTSLKEDLETSRSRSTQNDFIIINNQLDVEKKRNCQKRKIYSEDSDDNNPNKKKHNSRVPLLKILNKCLENPGKYSLGVKWKKEGESFMVNWKHFCCYYKDIGISTAQDINIKNRFTRHKIIKKSDEIPPDGFDVVYYYIKEEKPELERELVGQRLPDKIYIEDYLKEYQQYPCTETDINNVKELLLNESKGCPFITKHQLRMFHYRFGPLNQCIFKVRDFVQNNAIAWYHGAINRIESEHILNEYYKQNGGRSCFLLRAATKDSTTQSETLQYIFALSFCQLNGNICHMRLYTNRLFQLVTCVYKCNSEYQEKPVINYWELFFDKGDPVCPRKTLNLRMEDIPAVPDTYPWYNNYFFGYIQGNNTSFLPFN